MLTSTPPGQGLRDGGGDLLRLLLVVLRRRGLPLRGFLGLRLKDALRPPLCPLGDDEELDEDLPRLDTAGLPLLGEKDLERERIGLLIGERLRVRLRPMGDLLAGE